MTLAADTTLGPYQIESLIGRGGMGEVYRARDTRLNRDVAIKVLPSSVANDEGRIARFEREAKLLATLSHHHIAGIYGLEKIDGVRFLVLELVEGETLAERLAKGALPIEEALRLGRQLADGVAAAHERGVLHRDLKPANIKFTTDDEVKVLDFGIAKALESSDTTGGLANAVTLTGSHHTAAGTVVGTPFYMSPEQARGKVLDKRTDVWSFGCVMYECLVGRTAFGGETATDAIAKILEREPDYSALPAVTPPTVRLLLHRCLQKDRQKRLHDLRDARLAIEEAIDDPTGTTLGLGTSLAIASSGRRKWLPWLLAVVCAALAIVALWTSWAPTGGTRHAAPATYLSLLSTQAKLYWENPEFNLSPDGRTLVYVARRNAPDTAPMPPYELVVRRLESADATTLPGTERAFNPVFSPSGQWIAFLANDQSSPPNRTLKRVRLDGTPPVSIANLGDQNYWGALWLSNDTLLLNGWDGKPIFATVPVDGGNLQSVQLDTSSLSDYVSLMIHSVLPDGTTALGTVYRQFGVTNRVDTLLISLDTWACRTLLENADEPSYATSGHLAFIRDRSLAAVPFDLATGTTRGGVTPLLSGVGTYRLSRSSVLIYHPIAESLASRRLFTVDAQGKVEALSPVKKPFMDNLVGSVDGSWLAVEVFDDALNNSRIWAYEVLTDSIRPITAANELCFAPCISPDGRLLAYSRWSKEEISLVIRPLDGSADPRTLLNFITGKGWAMANCWSPDSQHILVQRWEKRSSDILRVPLDGGDPVPLLASSAIEFSARLSPDGKLLAYFSNESGEHDLYVRTYDQASAALGPKRRPASNVDSETLFWSHDGKTIYYVDESAHLIALAVTTDPALTVSEPRSVLDTDTLRSADDSFAPLPDGRLAYIRKGDQELEAEYFNVVLNWDSELKARAPGRVASSK